MTNHHTQTTTLHHLSKHYTLKEPKLLYIIENRKFERITIEILNNLAPIAFFPNEITSYPILNFSFKGLFIKNQINYKKEQILNIELEIPTIGKIPMCIEIIWINHSEPKGGDVEILDIPPEYKTKWAQFIKICTTLKKLKEEYLKLQNEKT